MATKDQIDKLNELQELKKKGQIEESEYNKKLKETLKTMKELSEVVKEYSQHTMELAANEARVSQLMGDTLTAYEANAEVLRQFKEITGDAYQSTENLTQAQMDKIAAAGLDVDAMTAQAESAQEYKDKIDALGPAYTKALKKSKPFFEDTATKMGLLSKKGNKVVSAIAEIGGMATQKGGLKGLAKAFTETFNPLNIGISILTKVIEQTIAMAFAVDKAGAAYAKSTGFGREFDGMIGDTREKLRRFGVSAEDAQKGLVALRTSISQFNVLSLDTQTNLSDTVVGLNKLGVGVTDSASSINNLNKSLGLNEQAAADVTREIGLSGKALGITTSKMVQDFNKSLGTLSMYGDKSVDIFMNIQTMASAAGVSIDTLMGLADKFGTFSSAAQTAAKMNAILGTSFSGVNMMMMDHDEITMEVIKGLQKTGVQFQKLDKFTQQAIASQLGMSLNDARKTLGMNIAEYKRMQKVQKAQAKKEEEMQKRMKETMDVVEELKIIMQEFAINIKPLIPTIRSIAEGVANFLVSLKDISPFMLVFIGLGSSLFGVLWNIAMLGIKIKIFGKVTGSAIATLSKTVSNALVRIGAAGTKAAPGLTAAGISIWSIISAVVAVGAVVAGIILSFAYLAKVILEGIAGVAQFGVSMLGLSATLISMGATLLAVAFGIKMIVLAVAGMANPFSMTGAAVLVGVIGAIAAAALAVGYVLDRFAASSQIASDFATLITTIASTPSAIGSIFSQMSAGIDEVSAALEGASGSRVTATLENIALITTGQSGGAMADASTSVGASLGKFVSEVSKYFSGDSESNKSMTVKLDANQTKLFLRGEVAKAHVNGPE